MRTPVARTVLVVVAVSLGGIAMAVIAFWASSGFAFGRPMFCRWKAHERGAHWQADFVAASDDVYIYVDQPLNMVVVARLKDTGIDNWSQKLRPGYATLFCGTPLETRLRPSPNSLIMIDPDGTTRSFHLASHVAEKVWQDSPLLARCNALEYLRIVYSGPQGDEFEVYLDARLDE